MFFVLSKTAGFFAIPSNLLIVLALAGAVLVTTRWATAGLRLMLASFILLAIAGFSPLANVLMLPLEQRFPPYDAAQGAPDGIIVLGGVIMPDVSAANGTVELSEAAERITAAVQLARRYPNARIVFSGGSGDLWGPQDSEASYARRMLESLGVAPERITLEDRSRNTFENAVFTRRLIEPKPGERWLLITSAHHMPRSIGCFRQAGFPVIAYPVDWRLRGSRSLAEPFNVLSGGLARTDVAVREWVGLVMYRISGHTSALFPAP